jgi:arylmalonate decarboxylase
VPADAEQLYGERFRFIAKGLGVGSITPEGFAPVIDSVIDCALELKRQGAEAISLMGTSISFYRGAEFTEGLRNAMHEATGLPCTTMSHAIVHALRRLGVVKVAVATSYVDDLNTRLVDYLDRAGCQVTAIEGLSIPGVGDAGAVTTETLVNLSKSVYRQDQSAQAIFMSCGGLLTLGAISRLEDELGLPAIGSSPTGFWDVVRTGGWDSRSEGAGKLFALQ